MKLYTKVTRVVFKYLNDRFQWYYIPGEAICIDETMMPWRGWLGFRQFIPSKWHKYGIKFFKLYLPHGYTHKFKIHVSAESLNSEAIGLSERVVLYS